MRHLDAWLGDELTPSVEARMHSWLDQGRQARLDSHRYALEGPGPQRSAVASLVSDCLDRFDMPAETGK